MRAALTSFLSSCEPGPGSGGALRCLGGPSVIAAGLWKTMLARLPKRACRRAEGRHTEWRTQPALHRVSSPLLCTHTHTVCHPTQLYPLCFAPASGRSLRMQAGTLAACSPLQTLNFDYPSFSQLLVKPTPLYPGRSASATFVTPLCCSASLHTFSFALSPLFLYMA